MTFWDRARATTQARIGLGRVGDGLPTAALLEFRRDYAAARDAVHADLDVPTLAAALGGAAVVHSQASDRAEYLRRPDLGRRLDPHCQLATSHPDLAIVLADGLSPTAVMRRGPSLVTAIAAALPTDVTVAQVVIATQARVAIGDQIAEQLGAATVLVIIGERPGLSVADSLGIYLTHRPTAASTDADRNCLSNIHPPVGLSYEAAAATTVRLLIAARERGLSGVLLKDTGNDQLGTHVPAQLN